MEKNDDSGNDRLETLTLPVLGMHCASCVNRVERFASSVDGVSDATVNLAQETVRVRFDPRQATLEKIVQSVKDSGYEIPTEVTELQIAGMTCASCVGRVERFLSNVPRVFETRVNLATERASVRWVAGMAVKADLEAAIKQSGYELIDEPSKNDQAENKNSADRIAQMRERESRNLLIRAIFALAVGLAALWGSAEFIPWAPDVLGEPYVLLAITTPVQFWAGWRFYRGTWKTASRLSADMNTLIAMGTSAAYFYSVVLTIWPDSLTDSTADVAYYYDTAAIIIGLILLGRYLEARAK
ncbi:MAG: copper ion binding protein, partial [Gammaproteobacteria bacterium]|nr:copper ion binding protein [Gammaproteobacteria bacterium]